MPTIDPRTHQPVSDDPGRPGSQRGGRLPGDPSLADAAENGGHSAGNAPDDNAEILPGEKRSK